MYLSVRQGGVQAGPVPYSIRPGAKLPHGPYVRLSKEQFGCILSVVGPELKAWPHCESQMTSFPPFGLLFYIQTVDSAPPPLPRPQNHMLSYWTRRNVVTACYTYYATIARVPGCLLNIALVRHSAQVPLDLGFLIRPHWT